jgi:hypothetical protein
MANENKDVIRVFDKKTKNLNVKIPTDIKNRFYTYCKVNGFSIQWKVANMLSNLLKGVDNGK